MSEYDTAFYENRHTSTAHSATAILSIVRAALPRIDSAVDIGCGVGTWLRELKENGTREILGVDGDWVKRKHLVIPEASFLTQDLCQEIKDQRRFDLAISLEVAEHLPGSHADQFVATLTRLADFVLFSAAIPGQGGVNHVNEQWPRYWFSKFAAHDFVPLDIIRKQIWQDESIPYWYRQNLFLLIAKHRIGDLSLDYSLVDATPAEQYLLYYDRLIKPLSPKQAIKALIRSLKRQVSY